MQAAERKLRKTLVGQVTSAKMDKTRRVEVLRLAKHPKYGKFLRRRTVCHVHDEKNASQEGDRVEIMETRPLSKTKRWRLVRVVSSVDEGLESVATDDSGADEGSADS
ncbi:30S ribosomal protein S17 [Planctomycetes bacterium Pan216]|uniref:Small ribosomal subunit protein uS17 n=1 Tax=Kolteria novifilia TaxID=2527975 RepID=A0A518AZL5_9BACT|nr:30S ribosomal protein S17 [Planctomycetes bacterium Pan216]